MIKLVLSNGYPHPYPSHLPAQEQDAINENLTELVLLGVVHFEWKYLPTIEFETPALAELARSITGWDYWEGNPDILAANYSVEDGYEHPALIVADKAYCGFILKVATGAENYEAKARAEAHRVYAFPALVDECADVIERYRVNNVSPEEFVRVYGEKLDLTKFD
jgi:hypothetical protein